MVGKKEEDPRREIIKIKASIPQKSGKLRVAGYARVSSDSYDQLNSFSAQVKYYTSLIEQNENWELVEIYADEGVTGVSTEKREDFNRLLDDCRRGKIDRIITKSTSRFSRNTMDMIQITRELKELGVTVLFEKENIDTAKITSENLLTLYSLFAQEESLSISKNCKKGNRMRMKKGTYVSSNPAYGYRLVDNNLEIYEPEAKIVRRIFYDYLGGISTVKIARELTKEGVPLKKSGTRWHYFTIANIIKNERYIGDMLLQKTYTEDALPYRRYKNIGELPKYYVKSTHDPIINRIQYELANILLKDRGNKINTNASEYLLSRKIKCRECGATYRRKISGGKTYWVCRTRDEDKHQCSAIRISEERIYETFIKMYNKLKQNYKVILIPMLSQLEKLQELKTRGNAEICTINKQIAELSEQNHVVNGLLSKGILDPALFISQSDELNSKIRSLKLEKSRLLEDSKEGDDTKEKTEELIEVFKNGLEYIIEINEALFEDVVESITVAENQEIHFKLINNLKLTESW